MLRPVMFASPKTHMSTLSETTAFSAALDPVAIAVPLKKRVSDTVNQPGNQPAQSR